MKTKSSFIKESDTPRSWSPDELMYNFRAVTLSPSEDWAFTARVEQEIARRLHIAEALKYGF